MLAVCELRYSEAYSLFDQTGRICKDLARLFTNFKVENPTPASTTMRADEGVFAVEMTQCRFTSQKPDTGLKLFAEHGKRFFDSILYNLDIRVFTRIGLRTFHRKEFANLEEAKKALAALQLINLQPMERFGADSEPSEIVYRWEGRQTGASLRLKAEMGQIDIVLPPEIGGETQEIHKSLTGLILDVDYYTVAPVERSQWDAAAWITNSFRLVRRQTDSILGE